MAAPTMTDDQAKDALDQIYGIFTQDENRARLVSLVAAKKRPGVRLT